MIQELKSVPQKVLAAEAPFSVFCYISIYLYKPNILSRSDLTTHYVTGGTFLKEVHAPALELSKRLLHPLD